MNWLSFRLWPSWQVSSAPKAISGRIASYTAEILSEGREGERRWRREGHKERKRREGKGAEGTEG